MQWGSLQVALWDKMKRRRISANDYQGDLDAYLRANPHVEVYNRQDAQASRAGNQVVAGTKLAFKQAGKELKVVLWDTRAMAKLPVRAGAPSVDAAIICEGERMQVAARDAHDTNVPQRVHPPWH